jgi:hypothetical protein
VTIERVRTGVNRVTNRAEEAVEKAETRAKKTAAAATAD